MNDKCKYCDYVSKCSRICEYNSYLCKVHRSFPKVVDKSYEQLQQENQQLKDKWNKLKEFIVEEYYMYLPLEASTKSITILINKMQELEGSDSND